MWHYETRVAHNKTAQCSVSQCLHPNQPVSARKSTSTWTNKVGKAATERSFFIFVRAGLLWKEKEQSRDEIVIKKTCVGLAAAFDDIINS